VNLVANLGTLHVRFLSLLENPDVYYQREHILDQPYGSRMTELKKCFPSLEEGNIRAIWNDLYNYGIVTVDSNVGIGGMMSLYHGGSDALTGLLTSFGQQFTQFMKTS
jgi:hypothetical protein